MCVHEIVVANKRPKWYIVDKQKALYTRTECDESRKIPKRSDYFFFFVRNLMLMIAYYGKMRLCSCMFVWAWIERQTLYDSIGCTLLTFYDSVGCTLLAVCNTFLEKCNVKDNDYFCGIDYGKMKPKGSNLMRKIKNKMTNQQREMKPTNCLNKM